MGITVLNNPFSFNFWSVWRRWCRHPEPYAQTEIIIFPRKHYECIR